MWGSIDHQQIDEIITKLNERKEYSMDDSFDESIDFAIEELKDLIGK